MVNISDMIRAIWSPTKRSRTPAIVVINTAEAPMPAKKRAASINPSDGANAAAMLAVMYNGKPMRSIASRPKRSESVPKIIWAICPMKKNEMIFAVSVECCVSPKCLRTSPNTGSIISIPSAVSIIVHADNAINSRVSFSFYGPSPKIYTKRCNSGV